MAAVASTSATGASSRRAVLLLAACQALAMSSMSILATTSAIIGNMLAADKTLSTLPVALQQLQASYFKDYSLIMSGVVVSVIPLLLLFLLAGRQLVGGIMAGAVKG